MRPFLAIALTVGMSACAQGDCPEEEHLCRGKCVFEGGLIPQACGTGDHCISCPDPHRVDAFPACLGVAPDGTGVCGLQCADRTTADCNHRPEDGCETRLDSDPQNCGACGAVCAGVCTKDGCIETLAEGEEGASGLAGDGPRAIWARRTGGAIEVRAVDAPGGPVSSLARVAAADGFEPTLASADTLFLATGGVVSADGGSGAVIEISPDGGVEELATGLDGPIRIVAFQRTAVWTDFNGGKVMSASPDSGVVTLASGRAHPKEIAASAGLEHVGWIEDGVGSSRRVIAALPDGGTETLSNDPQPANLIPEISLTGRMVWSDDITSSLWSGAPGGVAIEDKPLPAPEGGWQVTSLAASLFRAFWTDRGRHALRAFCEGGRPCDVSSAEADPRWLTSSVTTTVAGTRSLRTSYLFWIDGARIRRLRVSP